MLMELMSLREIIWKTSVGMGQLPRSAFAKDSVFPTEATLSKWTNTSSDLVL